jgi:hypothetical protein
MTVTSNSNVSFRGATVQFSTTFKDANGNVTQPASAAVSIVYPLVGGGMSNPLSVPMTPPTFPAVVWTAQWDTRDVGPGVVYCSIHSGGGPPSSVEDFQFTLTANPANLLTF